MYSRVCVYVHVCVCVLVRFMCASVCVMRGLQVTPCWESNCFVASANTRCHKTIDHFGYPDDYAHTTADSGEIEKDLHD